MTFCAMCNSIAALDIVDEARLDRSSTYPLITAVILHSVGFLADDISPTSETATPAPLQQAEERQEKVYASNASDANLPPEVVEKHTTYLKAMDSFQVSCCVVVTCLYWSHMRGIVRITVDLEPNHLAAI